MCETETSTDDEAAVFNTNNQALHHSRAFYDARLEPICNYTLTTLRLKPDKWQKMMATDEFRFIVLDWINNPNRRLLVMILSPSGHLIPKNTLSDLYHNYAIHKTPTPATAATSTASASVPNTTQAAIASNLIDSAVVLSTNPTNLSSATAIVNTTVSAATASLVPLPPPSSSFSTLDGVPRGKCAYFVRRQIGSTCPTLTGENFHQEILCGDLPVHAKIETLAILFDEVFAPLLESPSNRKLWPDIVAKDLHACMKDIRNTLSEIKGKTNNRTILSLLVSQTIIEEVATHVNQGNLCPAKDPKFRNLLEEMFINWTTQIHEIINERSDTSHFGNAAAPSFLSSGGLNAVTAAALNANVFQKLKLVTLPAHEINFWSNRRHNLHNIYEQLRSSPHRTLAHILERIESAYFIPFTNIFKDLMSAWHEAQDVTLWLQPLLRQTTAFNAVNFINANDLIPPLVHVLHLIWVNSCFYRSTQRMSVLLRCVCNMLVNSANEDLDFAMLFHVDADEGLTKINKTIEILELFREKLNEYREKYSNNHNMLPPLPTSTITNPENTVNHLWRFSSEEVFGPVFDVFLTQLLDIRRIFEAAVSFQNLERLEIGGLRGKFLTERIRRIFDEFKLLFEQWSLLDVNNQEQHATEAISLLTQWRTLKQKEDKFFTSMEILEKKLATVLVQTFIDCHNWEQLVKLALMLGSILQRRNVQPELKNCLLHIFKIYEHELQQLEAVVSEVLLGFEYRGLSAIPIGRNFPPIAGSILWVEQHQQRCNSLAAKQFNESIKQMIVHCTNPNEQGAIYEQLQTRRNVLTTKLSRLELQIRDEWRGTIDRKIKKGLDAAVMQRVKTTHNVNHIIEKELEVKKRNHQTSLYEKCHGKWVFNENIKRTTNSDEMSGRAEISPSSAPSMSACVLLDINFCTEIFTLFKETKYLQAMERVNLKQQQKQQQQSVQIIDAPMTSSTSESIQTATLPGDNLPNCLLDLYAKHDEYWQRKIKLIKIAEFYNGIHANVRSQAELQLICKEIKTIDECIDIACETLTWRNYDSSLIEQIYFQSQALFRRLNQTHRNLESILANIQRWSREPLHQRSLYGKNLLDLRHQQERLRLRLQHCKETKTLLNRLLIANFCLFFNYNKQSFEIYSRDLNVQEFLHEFPIEQRHKYNNYLAAVDRMIYHEARQSMLISLQYLHNEMTASNSATLVATAGEIARNSVGVFLGTQLIPQEKQHQQRQQTQEELERVPEQQPQPLPLTTATPPLFEVKLELADGTEIRFTPSFDTNMKNNFQQIVEQLLEDIIQTCNCMPRIVDDNALSEDEECVENQHDNSDDNNDDGEGGEDVAEEAYRNENVTVFNADEPHCRQQRVQIENDSDEDEDKVKDSKERTRTNTNENDVCGVSGVGGGGGDGEDGGKGKGKDIVDIDKVEQTETFTKNAMQQLQIGTTPTKTKPRRLRQRRSCWGLRQRQRHQHSPATASVQAATTLKTAKADDEGDCDGDGENGVQQLSDGIRNALRTAMEAAATYAANFNEFAFLWTQQQKDVLRASLNAARENAHNAEASKGYAILETFKKEIDRYNDLHESIDQFDSRHCVNGWLAIDANPLKYALLNLACKWANLYKQWLLRYVQQTLKELNSFIANGLYILELHIMRDDFRGLLRILAIMAQIKERANYADNIFKPLKEIIALLRTYNVEFKTKLVSSIEQLPFHWKHLKDVALTKYEALQSIRHYQEQRITAYGCIFSCHLDDFVETFYKMKFFQVPCLEVYPLCDKVFERLFYFTNKYERITRWSKLLDIAALNAQRLLTCSIEVKRIKQLWDFVRVIESCIVEWHGTPWLCIDTDDIENECKKFTRDLRTLDKSIREWAPYVYIVGVLKDLVASLRTITELQNPAITERHWMELMQVTKLSFKCDENTTFQSLLKLKVHEYEEEIKNTVDRAIKEMTVTRVLDDIKATWARMEFEVETHQRRQNLKLLKVSEELIETLDDNQMQLQNIATSKHIEYLLDKLSNWQRCLSDVDTLITNWFEVQRKWSYLENIFIGSLDIREQLPMEAQRFEAIDNEFIELLQQVGQVRVVIEVVKRHSQIFSKLIELQQRLAACEKALNDYLETKRLAFPRFYFISSADLLDILSNGNNAQVIDRHLIKLFDSLLRLEYETNTTYAIGMHSKENDEYVRFTNNIDCRGRVEVWLNAVIMQMRHTLHELLRRSLQAFIDKPRDQWLYDWPAQVALCCSQICWTTDVNRAFAWIEEGYEGAIKDLHKRQVTQLNALINLLLGELSPGDRQKIMTICIHDVHSRDVVSKIIQAKIDNSLTFQWQSQLRHRWDDASSLHCHWMDVNGINEYVDEDCFANICDAEFRYAYEYLGNTSRLVITPLTDRCYITLTQSLHLVMGGAPSGPAGTGKTETTKDLGRALGVMVYVFNCSEQMDYKSCGNIYKGLSQTGAWGCFDEFNRISVEVLSVIAVQVKTIQEAIKTHKSRFIFMGESIQLIPSVGIFITMNPGYAGRTELPENLKTLFRPCAMIVPDFALICEIMLMAEGFQEARLLARKFITLYTLCRELLSQQDHYDWGLRAIKSVLVVAGTLKRDDHSRPEDQVLMRALRDFNMPKIVTDDIPIFMGLIGDLFPALDVPRKRVFEFEKTIRRAVNEIKLQPEEGVLMKVVQLQELLDVRHSVFIVGNAGTGKTKIWQTLLETYRIQKIMPVCNVLNPKALSNDELFGIVNPTTREWKDGLFSSIMREQANMLTSNPKWMVLDGDIDPMWIESLNTLMDDNKILTLASNERISLKKDMRLLFEVGHLKAATPATVSRAGILYVNPQDLGWSPYVSSWLETRIDVVERGALSSLFEKYFPSLVVHQHDFRRTTPITDMAMIQMTCSLLECLLDDESGGMKNNSQNGALNSSTHSKNPHNLHHSEVTPDSVELKLETVFVYASMWGFGSALYQDHITDWRREFHKWWTTEFKDIKLPSQGTIFDYRLDVHTQKFQRWSEIAALEKFETIESEVPLQSILVPTAETTRLCFFLKLLIDRNLACMLVGNSGCGKGAIFRELFSKYSSLHEMHEIAIAPTGGKSIASIANAASSSSLSTTAASMPKQLNHRSRAGPLLTTVQTTHFNFYTTSEIFQKILDSPLEKKSGRCYAPSGPNRRLIYFVNDLNMPEVDAYGTVQPHTIMRQFMDYKQWYDRQRLQLKDIRNCQFVASMNPTAGSFTIDPRLQRHFCVFSVPPPNEETLHYIYNTILSNHLDNPFNGFNKELRSIGSLLVQVGVALQRRVEYAFLPTAVKFHYAFNLRDLTCLYQGLMNSIGPNCPAGGAGVTGTLCTKPADLIRLYVHEAYRIYHDRLVDIYDIKSFRSSIRDIFKKDFEDFDEDYVFGEPLIYCHFAQSLVDQKYMPLKSWNTLYQLLMEAQAIYNDVIGYMNLVMFEDAMLHVCRINRILESPRGNALLIGVGGSGKQTLARLASFISSFNVFQIQIKRGFSLQDMKDEISVLYMKVGLKSVASVFLMSDAQIPDESILMLINDLLASGEIPELFSDDQLETIINGIRNEVKQSGTLDTKDNCWRFFIEKIRRLLKVVLCFSPVGQTLRVRARKFPAIISRTAIDWFHEWPRTALESVSQKFLKEIDYILPSNNIAPIGCFMAYVHGTVNQISKIYLQNEKRYNYTTPKTYLEYIFLYRKLLVKKNGEYTQRIQRLQSGMSKLAECACQVDKLKDQLAVQEVQLMAKNAAADKLIVIVSAESEKVKREKHIASEEEKRVRIIEEDVSIKTKMCEEDLRQAEPALIAAQVALNTLNKNNLTELKSFGSPPKAVVNVCAAVMVLFATNGKIPRDRSWKAAKLMMVRVDQFLNDLVNYNKDNIHPNIIDVLQEYLKDPEFNPDKVVQKSVAAAGLCAWVINLHRYHQVFLIVGPKQKALEDSQDELREARDRLQFLKVKINELEKKLHEIQTEFEEAVAAKQKCKREADKTAFTIDLAHRLINGLANENVRWKESVQSLQAKIGTLPGDILLISSFLSYVGCFTRRYREELQHKMWMPKFRKIDPHIACTEGVDPLTLFSDDAQIAAWNNEGLPMDRMSTENATILANSTRWPLMIDPQLQGIKWIKNHFGDSLVVVRLTQKGFLETLEKSMGCGDTVLIEQIEETLDTVLEPLLSRALIKKGRFIRIGDKEIDFNTNFRLILHTKLANPHYKPEMQAQTTLINFTVTPDGLEEQLLAEVVKIERPDLERMKTEVTVQQNKFKIALKSLEDELLARLASAGKNVLDDHALVFNLEETKRTVDEIELKVAEAHTTTMQIDDARNIYRAAARRAAILYFVLTDLSRINPIYKFSLKSFMHVFRQAIATASQCKSYERRVIYLVDSITLQTFLYTLRGLFEADKLTFTSHMVLRIMIAAEQISKDEIDFLLRFPHDPNTLSPLEFVSRSSWGGIKSLAMIEHFYGIDKDMESYPKRWRKFLASDVPEREQFPGEWKHRTPLQKLCIIRALRPDRMTYAMRLFIDLIMGPEYAKVQPERFANVFEDVNAATPICFILSPGVDPIRDVERLGQQLGFTSENDTLVNISLGQGQEVVAEDAINKALINGKQWIVLQNIHLVVNWLPTLEKLIERISNECESNKTSQFRLFISAEPAPDPQYHVIPQGILESSLKIVNEPPAGMAANLHKAWDNFSQETLETCTQEAEFKSILFALCYFHAVAGERRKFGPQGWNKVYPFNIGDLSISANVLHNYLEGSNRIPWEDLRYLFGEIMYGGHITDDWDRRVCQTYLEVVLQQDLIDGDFELCPGFPAPPNLDFEGYHNYISEVLPAESPVLYGLHSNAEIGFLTSASDQLLKTVFELQPRDSELSADCGAPREELVKIMIDDFLDKLQDEFNLNALLMRVERKTPFVVVSLQECERMNALIREIKRSLRELMLGLKGELTITLEMERLDHSIFYDHIPDAWSRLAYPSLLGLQSWFADLLHRIKELSGWLNDFKLPCAIWLGGLFNPQSFLTAIMQESARKHDLPLDRMCLSCEVTKKDKDDVSLPPMEGAFVHALYLDGASWDCQLNSIVPLHQKELLCTMPVIYIKSIVQEKQELQSRIYECPLYKTRSRGNTFVWTFNLKTRERPSKWILCGVALLLQT